MQVDGNDDAMEDSDGLILCKQILDRLLRNECDQFEILSFGNNFFDCILREEGSDYYSRLL